MKHLSFLNLFIFSCLVCTIQADKKDLNQSEGQKKFEEIKKKQIEANKKILGMSEKKSNNKELPTNNNNNNENTDANSVNNNNNIVNNNTNIENSSSNNNNNNNEMNDPNNVNLSSIELNNLTSEMPLHPDIKDFLLKHIHEEKKENNNNDNKNNVQNNNEEWKCPICLSTDNPNNEDSDPELKDRTHIKLPCGHEYHRSCGMKSLAYKNTCPCCRKETSLLDLVDKEIIRIHKIKNDGVYINLQALQSYLELVGENGNSSEIDKIDSLRKVGFWNISKARLNAFFYNTIYNFKEWKTALLNIFSNYQNRGLYQEN